MISHSHIELRLPAGEGVEVCLRGALGDVDDENYSFVTMCPTFDRHTCFLFFLARKLSFSIVDFSCSVLDNGIIVNIVGSSLL